MASPEGKWMRLPALGMDERVVPALGSAERIENMRHDPEGYWVTMPGFQTLNRTRTEPAGIGPFPSGSGAILSFVWFQPRPHQRFLVAERATADQSSEIVNVSVQAGTYTTIATRRRLGSNDLGTLFLESARWLYMFSPVDAPVRWNGTRLVPLGFVSPTPRPECAGPDQGFNFVDRAAGTWPGTFKSSTKQRGIGPYPDSADTNFRYGYAVTEINDLGQESPLSAITWISGVNDDAASGGFQMGRIKLPRAASHIAARRIWRTRNTWGATSPGEGATVYLHSEWMAAHDFEILDTTPDSELGLVAFDRDSVGPFPVGARAAAFHQSRLFLGGMPENSHMVRFSVAGLPEQMPLIYEIPVGTAKTGPVVAFKSISRGLVVFKTGGVYLILGSTPTDYRVEVVTEEEGCAAPRALEIVAGLGMFFLAKNGPRMLVGALNDAEKTSVQPIGDGIRKTWRRRAGVSLQTAVSVYDPDFAEVWFHIPEGGNSRPTLGLAYHLRLGQWSLRTGGNISGLVRYDGMTWASSWDDSTDNSAGIHVLTPGAPGAFGGATVTSRYRTNYVVLDNSAQVIRAEVGVMALGGSGFSVGTRTDHADANTNQTETGNKAAKHPSHEREVWNTARWGSAFTWTDYEQARVPVSLFRFSGHELQLRVQSTRMRLYALHWLIPPGSGAVSPLRQERS